MKAKNLFSVSCLVFFVVIFKGVGQNNLYVPQNDNNHGFSNVLLGGTVGANIPAGNSTRANVFIGNQAAFNTTTNSINNVFIGYNSGYDNLNGSSNTFVGYGAGRWNTTSNENTCIGYSSGGTGEQNSSFGFCSGSASSGSYNTFLGYQAGYQSSGSNNVFIGFKAGLSTTYSNRLVIKDKLNSQALVWGEFDNRKLLFNVDNGTADPFSSYVEINGNNNASGLKFTNLNNLNSAIDNTTNKVLSVNSTGDVILVKDIGGGVTQNCSTANFVPVNGATAGQLNCSQIFDNGASVGIGTTGVFNYSYNTGDFLALAPASGTAKLKVNGVAWTTGYYASSDQKFKKDIKPIENALEKVQQINGKTYSWNKEVNKDMNFDDGGHSGFIAQELEKVLPHLVATAQNGDKAVNYIELMPYLVEAIKDQQTQINDLKAQLSENFKAQNQDLIELTNTKIINVSPNPSNDMITVSFNVEKSVQLAKLNVHDLNGNVISSLNINDRENNITRTLQKDNFGKGIYVVSLVINGKSIDTKKIVFN